MPLYKGIPFDGGMDSPSGTGAQHIVQTCRAIIDAFYYLGTPGSLSDLESVLALDFNTRNLYDADGDPSMSWTDRYLYDDDDVLALDWSARELHGATGNIVIAWADTTMFDDDATDSLDWGGRQCKSTTGATNIDWNAERATGGAATAGVLYGATEQGMIQKAYDALRTFGLLT